MKNTINSGSLDMIQENQTLLLQARKVNGGKIQLEFAELIKTSTTSANPLGMFNKSDDRFNVGNKARRAWLTSEAKDASIILGLDLSDSAKWTVDGMGREVLELNVLNPVADINGTEKVLKVEIVETIEPTEWQAQNLQTSAKRRGKDGAFITHKGMYIFANTRVVFDKANHVLLEPDATVKAANGIPAGVDLNTGELFN
jgi:hypothetical protein